MAKFFPVVSVTGEANLKNTQKPPSPEDRFCREVCHIEGDRAGGVQVVRGVAQNHLAPAVRGGAAIFKIHRNAVNLQVVAGEVGAIGHRSGPHGRCGPGVLHRTGMDQPPGSGRIPVAPYGEEISQGAAPLQLENLVGSGIPSDPNITGVGRHRQTGGAVDIGDQGAVGGVRHPLDDDDGLGDGAGDGQKGHVREHRLRQPPDQSGPGR